MRTCVIDHSRFYCLEDGTLFPVLAGAKGKAPKPTPEERELQATQAESVKEQLEIARRQEAENEALLPILLSEQNLTRTVDPTTGKITYTKAPDALADKRKEIEGMQLDRSLKALKGELPVTVTLQKELELGKRTLAEKLGKQLGPGWETSSAGIQALAEYERMATALKEGEQKDQLSTAEALSINRQGSRANANANIYDTIYNPNAGASGLLSTTGSGAAQGLQYYSNLRNAKLQSRATAAGERSGYASALLGGAGLGIGAFMASDPELKTDIEPVDDATMLLAVRKMPVKKWRYKDDPEKRVHIGGMATDMPAIVSDTKQVDIISYLGMITGAVRALDKKVSEVAAEEMPPALLLAS